MDTDTGEIAGHGVGADQRRSGVYEITSGNYSAVDAYEPGSVGKVITIAGALNEGVVTPETTLHRAVARAVSTPTTAARLAPAPATTR